MEWLERGDNKPALAGPQTFAMILCDINIEHKLPMLMFQNTSKPLPVRGVMNDGVSSRGLSK